MVWVQISAKEEKKIRDKERKQMEDAARMKAEALRDDDLAFDVAFEAPTDTEAAAEARDIKVSARWPARPQAPLPMPRGLVCTGALRPEVGPSPLPAHGIVLHCQRECGDMTRGGSLPPPGAQHHRPRQGKVPARQDGAHHRQRPPLRAGISLATRVLDALAAAAQALGVC